MFLSNFVMKTAKRIQRPDRPPHKTFFKSRLKLRLTSKLTKTGEGTPCMQDRSQSRNRWMSSSQSKELVRFNVIMWLRTSPAPSLTSKNFLFKAVRKLEVQDLALLSHSERKTSWDKHMTFVVEMESYQRIGPKY